MSLGLKLAAPKLTLGQSVNTPKSPKMTGMHISQVKAGGPIKVKHLMSGGAKAVTFNFQNPALMNAHLKRIEKNEWLHPQQDPARKITSVLDLGHPA